MKLQRVYLDTSVLGGCFDDEFASWSNALIRNFRQRVFLPALSDLLAAEVNDAPESVRALYAELVQLNPAILTITPEVIDLASHYQQRGILTPKYYDDGLHIALATVFESDVLVSWNFKHIVHFDKIRLFSAVNLEQGYKPLSIYSPREVARNENDS